MARSSTSKPTSLRDTPSAFCRRSTSAPRNSSFFQPTIQPRSASSDGRRLVHVVAVEAHRRLEPQRIAGAEAGRHEAGRRAGGKDRVPHALSGRGRHEHLEAVLAGVAGPRDRPGHARDLAGREPVVLDVGERHAGQRLQDVARGRPLDRDQRIPRAGVHRDGVAEAGDLFGDPAEVLDDVRRVHDEHEVLVRQLVGQHVVHERALRGW